MLLEKSGKSGAKEGGGRRFSSPLLARQDFRLSSERTAWFHFPKALSKKSKKGEVCVSLVDLDLTSA